MAFQAFDIKHTWLRSFQKCFVCSKLDIYVFINNHDYSSTSSLLYYLSYKAMIILIGKESWLSSNETLNEVLHIQNVNVSIS